MRKAVPLTLLFISLLVLPRLVTAQDSSKPAEPPAATEPAPHYYHLDFAVQELDGAGKPINSRTYTTSVSTDRHFTGSIRTGSRIPVATGAFETGKDQPLTNVQFQYVDVGVSFDLSHVVEVGPTLAIDLSAEISSIADSLDARIHQPIIRQNRWRAPVLVPLGKPTVVFKSDSLDSKGSLQVTVTAKPLE
ncbi:MAG: hypothetical protein KGL64_11030 [Acidobacteriota bacterium]|nr:hypothetical protein [Acidobacteriota bacterium]